MDFFDQLEEIGKPSVEKKPWMGDVELILATESMLEGIAQECIEAVHFGLDLETTGLDQRAFPNDAGTHETVDKIVGYCIAPTTTRAFYIPVRHKESEKNVPPRLVANMVRKIQEGGGIAVFHNAKFDQKFLMYEPAGNAGSWEDPKSWDDTLILAYLRNSRARNKGLKSLSKNELGREMIELRDLFPSEDVKAKRLDFSTLDPSWEPVVWYAAADALNTLSLFHLFHSQVVGKDEHNRGQKTLYLIEKICLTATMWMEQCRIHIDRTKLEELIRLGQGEWWDCIGDVYRDVEDLLGRDARPSWMQGMGEVFDPQSLQPNYREVRESFMVKKASLPPIPKSVPSLLDPKILETIDFPYSYDITIPAELGKMLRELGVAGLKATEKSGQVKTSKDVLEGVIDKQSDKYPWMSRVKRFREIDKALGTNLFPIYHDTTPTRSPDGCVWANFNGTKVDTGRFSTPTPRGGAFFGQVHWNVQSTTATYDKSKPQCARRQRECVSARPDHLLFAIDYSGVELRIVTNLSMEPKWLAEFFRCSSCDRSFERGILPPPFCPTCGSDKIGDLHSLTALGIYGESAKDASDFKQKRQVGKIVNFLLCYGGGGNAVTRSTGVPKEEGWRIKNQFDKTYKGLVRWWHSQHKVAFKQKYVTTAFGRKYPVPDIVHEQRGFREKAKRNAVNGPVQGSSADIMKLAMGLLYREFQERGWLDRLFMTITIHDELVFEVHKSLASEAVPVIEHIMCVETVKNLGWVVPLKVDIEFGEDWTVPYNLTELMWGKGDGEWTPELMEIFPSQYHHFCDVTGKVAEIPRTAQEPSSEKPLRLPPTVKETALRSPSEPSSYVYRIPSPKLTAHNATKLAKVIAKTSGKGLDDLRIEDDLGNDLLGRPVKVAYQEFRLLASYEGL